MGSGLLVFVAAWTAMRVAMMLPSVLPTLLLALGTAVALGLVPLPTPMPMGGMRWKSRLWSAKVEHLMACDCNLGWRCRAVTTPVW